MYVHKFSNSNMHFLETSNTLEVMSERSELDEKQVFVYLVISCFLCTLYICIGNSMVSSAIWKKHARVSFSKTIEIARVRRTSAI